MFEFLRRRKARAEAAKIPPKALPAALDADIAHEDLDKSLDSLDMSSDDVLAVDLDDKGGKRRSAESSLSVARSVIGEDMEVRGPITTASPIQILGLVNGDVTAGDEVTVDASGRVTGKIQATRVTVRGVVKGPVSSSGRLMIASTGQVHGDVAARALHVDDGGQLQGRCSMKSD